MALDPFADLSGREAGGQQLPASDDPLLTGGQDGNDLVDRHRYWFHANQNLCSADLAPLSLPLPYSPRPRLVLKSITSGTPCSS